MLGIFRDIRNRRIIVKAIKSWKDTPEWNKYNLMHDWFYRLGAVINLNKEYFGEDDKMKQMRVVESSRPVFEFISEQMKIGDLIQPDMKYIDGTYSYLITFHQICNKFSFIWAIKWILILFATGTLLININEIINLLYKIL